jgi:hypothetical protein
LMVAVAIGGARTPAEASVHGRTEEEARKREGADGGAEQMWIRSGENREIDGDEYEI